MWYKNYKISFWTFARFRWWRCSRCQVRHHCRQGTCGRNTWPPAPACRRPRSQTEPHPFQSGRGWWRCSSHCRCPSQSCRIHLARSPWRWWSHPGWSRPRRDGQDSLTRSTCRARCHKAAQFNCLLVNSCLLWTSARTKIYPSLVVVPIVAIT